MSTAYASKDILRFLSRFWFLLLIGGFMLWGALDSGTSTPLPPPSTTAQTDQEPTYVPDLTPGNSLPTGTILKSVARTCRARDNCRLAMERAMTQWRN